MPSPRRPRRCPACRRVARPSPAAGPLARFQRFAPGQAVEHSVSGPPARHLHLPREVPPAADQRGRFRTDQPLASRTGQPLARGRERAEHCCSAARFPRASLPTQSPPAEVLLAPPSSHSAPCLGVALTLFSPRVRYSRSAGAPAVAAATAAARSPHDVICHQLPSRRRRRRLALPRACACPCALAPPRPRAIRPIPRAASPPERQPRSRGAPLHQERAPQRRGGQPRPRVWRSPAAGGSSRAPGQGRPPYRSPRDWRCPLAL